MAQRGRGLAHSAQTNPAQPFKPQAQDRGATPPWKGNLGHQTSSPKQGLLEPCQHLHEAHGRLRGRRMLKEEGPRQKHVEKGVKLPSSDGRRNFPLLPGGLGGTWWQQLLLSEKGVSGSPPPPPLLLPASPGSGQMGTRSCWISQRKA